MRKRLLRIEDPAKVTEGVKIKGNDANVQAVDMTWDEQKELKQVNALYNLLDDKFVKEAPFHERLRYPASNEAHYDAILAESERAPSRGFWDKFTNRLKGSIRLS